MDKRLLTQIERYIISFFRQEQHNRILAKDLFESTSVYANADIVRALEDLEKKQRLLVRHTTEGNDYISLTSQGVDLLGLEEANVDNDDFALPHPPRSATKAT
jgi:RIO-like serine/threonine protein kinase